MNRFSSGNDCRLEFAGVGEVFPQHAHWKISVYARVSHLHLTRCEPIKNGSPNHEYLLLKLANSSCSNTGQHSETSTPVMRFCVVGSHRRDARPPKKTTAGDFKYGEDNAREDFLHYDSMHCVGSSRAFWRHVMMRTGLHYTR